jgi:hypothetical protein
MKERGDQGGDNFERLLKDIDVPGRNELSVSSFENLTRSFAELRKDASNTDELMKYIKSEIGPEGPIIRGPVEIARGKQLILAITPDQENAFDSIYSVDWETEVNYYASIESIGDKPKKTEALVKYVEIKPKSADHLIISQGLAEALGVKNNQDVRVLSLYYKTSDIDLDELP